MRKALAAMAGLLVACGSSWALAADYAGSPARHGRGHRLPTEIGACVRTRVAQVGAVQSGPLIAFEDGVVEAFDIGIAGHETTQPGDPAQLCLVSYTRDCRENEQAGRTYATGNLRTGAAWTLPDIRSSCRAQ